MKNYTVFAKVESEQKAKRLRKNICWFCKNSEVKIHHWASRTATDIWFIEASCTGGVIGRKLIGWFNGFKETNMGKLCVLQR